MGSKYLPDNFFDYPWTNFFEEYDAETFNKEVPPDQDLVLDDKGNFARTDGTPGIVMRLVKTLMRPQGDHVYYLIRSKYVQSILKRHDLRAWLQNALERLYSSHRDKEDFGDAKIDVPASLFAALIQARLELEAEVEILNNKLTDIQKVMDEHTVPTQIVVAPLDPEKEAAIKRMFEEDNLGGRVEVRTLPTGGDHVGGVEPAFSLSYKPDGAVDPKFEHISTETGRITSSKPDVEEVDPDDDKE